MCHSSFTGKRIGPQGGPGVCSRSVSEEGTEPELTPGGPAAPMPHSPASRLLGPASRAGLTCSPSLSSPCFQHPFSADVVPNPCPKPRSPQALLPAMPPFPSQSLPPNCLRCVPSSVFAWTLPDPATHLPWVLCGHHIYKTKCEMTRGTRCSSGPLWSSPEGHGSRDVDGHFPGS